MTIADMPEVVIVDGRIEMKVEVPEDHEYVHFVLQKIDYELRSKQLAKNRTYPGIVFITKRCHYLCIICKNNYLYIK